MKCNHKQCFITLYNSDRIMVDKAIRHLIRAMNTDDLETYNSCQNNRQYGYVQFGGVKAQDFVTALAHCFTRYPRTTLGGIRFEKSGRENKQWPRSFTLRWLTYDYPKVLRLVKKALWKVEADTSGLW